MATAARLACTWSAPPKSRPPMSHRKSDLGIQQPEKPLSFNNHLANWKMGPNSDCDPLRVASQPRTPRVPDGVFTLKSPLFCEPVINRSVPREASIATLPVPLFGSYTNLSRRTVDEFPTLRFVLSLKRRPVFPCLPVRTVSSA